MSRTWKDFRQALADGCFSYDETDKAKEYEYLKAFDNIFIKHSGMKHLTVRLCDLFSSNHEILRCVRINGEPLPKYERFIPYAKYITQDNRFSPPGVEWLYLATAEKDGSVITPSTAAKCAIKECGSKAGDCCAICHFKMNKSYRDAEVVDLTAANDKAYAELNDVLESKAQQMLKQDLMRFFTTEKLPTNNPTLISGAIIHWVTYTYAKLMSEQIFVPITTADKHLEYAPFQTLAQYFISLGFSGIVYSSTVFPQGRNIVLFDKEMATPYGKIEQFNL